MLPLETLAPFFAASVLLCLAPGPDNIFVLTQSALRGRSAGLAVMLGLCTGLVGHSTAVALGVAVVFQTSALAFSMLKFIGAGYLIYLAWQAFRAPATPIEASGSENLRLGKYYSRGIIMNITNPKVSIFFLAFLPQFADPLQQDPKGYEQVDRGGLRCPCPETGNNRALIGKGNKDHACSQYPRL
jgi:threonine/homoserine/homoserine lactone efflux protein